MPALRIDIWSDIACPWCYVGKRRFEAALATFPHAANVEIVWRSFELDPSAPAIPDPEPSYTDRLAKKFRTSRAQAEVMLQRMTETAAEAGLEFHFERTRGGNTFDAHRLLHLAHEQGVQGALKERLFRAYFTEGHAIGDREVLVQLAGEAGLDAALAREVLASERFTTEVRQDQALARELGITGVPFFVLAGRLGVSGAQPSEVLRGALDRAWSELSAKPLETIVEGAACGPDGCD